MCAIVQKKRQKKGKKGQYTWKFGYFKNISKMYKIWKYFEKGQPQVCDCRIRETARICPDISIRTILDFWAMLVLEILYGGIF